MVWANTIYTTCFLIMVLHGFTHQLGGNIDQQSTYSAKTQPPCADVATSQRAPVCNSFGSLKWPVSQRAKRYTPWNDPASGVKTTGLLYSEYMVVQGTMLHFHDVSIPQRIVPNTRAELNALVANLFCRPFRWLKDLVIYSGKALTGVKQFNFLGHASQRYSDSGRTKPSKRKGPTSQWSRKTYYPM